MAVAAECADCSISLKFGTEFDHVTADTTNVGASQLG